LGRQWEILARFVPGLSKLKLSIRLAEVKQLPWYIQGYDKHKKAVDEESISAQAELEGLELMLSHSLLCLNLASHRDAHKRNDLLMNSLSILLPIVSGQLYRYMQR
jgi:hypothetical protein